MDRKKWVLGRCGMAVLSVNMTYWTYEAEKAINDGGHGSLAKLSKLLDKQLNDIVELIR